MSAGTITLTNNSATVTGSGTAFTTDLKAGDFVTATVGGTLYSLIVSAIASNTSLTLNLAYTGPTTGSLAWAAVPSQVLAAITAQIVVESTKALRGLNFDKANWQQIFTGTGNVTVTMPDMTTWTGPAWNGITTQLNNKAAKGANSDITSLTGLTTALTVAQGGTGGKTQADARTGLGLGTSATASLQTYAADNTVGRVLTVGAFGIGGPSISAATWGSVIPYSYALTSGVGGPEATGFMGIQIAHSVNPDQYNLQIAARDGRIYHRSLAGGTYLAWQKFYHTGNTTTNSSGALVPASPIVRIVNNRDTASRNDILGVDNDEYSWSTVRCLYNEEAKGVTVSRLGTGEYLVKGAIGLAKDLWSVMDCGNGQGRIIALAEAEETQDGIVVRCYKQKFILSDDGELLVSRGSLIDIPDETWIDVRLQMPEDSAWKTRMLETATSQKSTATKTDASTQTE